MSTNKRICILVPFARLIVVVFIWHCGIRERSMVLEFNYFREQERERVQCCAWVGNTTMSWGAVCTWVHVYMCMFGSAAHRNKYDLISFPRYTRGRMFVALVSRKRNRITSILSHEVRAGRRTRARRQHTKNNPPTMIWSTQHHGVVHHTRWAKAKLQ